jgi:LmbE family N-acetylglucosaminyl deacetylase
MSISTWELRLDARRLRLPDELAANGQTALLEIELLSTFAGGLLEPWIEVIHHGGAYRQYFERGVTGRRWLNLSPVFEARGDFRPPGHIRLRSRGLQCADPVSLSTYVSPRLDDASVMVIAPHPDDAEIACFGLYATNRACIVTLTAGERGAVSPGAHFDAQAAARWRAELRVEDSLSIPALGAVPRDRCMNLAYPDGALACLHARAPDPVPLFGHDVDDRAALRRRNVSPALRDCSTPTWPELVRELAGQLEHHAPSIVCCPHPLLDGHPDHVFAAVALGAALEKASLPAPDIFLYVVHSATDIRYPFGPPTAVVAPAPGLLPHSHADTIYSHRVDPQMRLRKCAAIAANRDIQAHQQSFLRRGPRPNEIYYVTCRDTFSKLLAVRASHAAH